jgi:starch phosphorylase
VQQLYRRFNAYLSDVTPWAKLSLPARITRQNPVAYFCAEFGVHNSLPLYSGGLGILAGDHLKSASDLNLPLVAIGLFYRFGYFRQRLRRDDWQEEEYRENHIDELALTSVDDEQGKPLLIQVGMRGRTVSAASVARRRWPRTTLPARYERAGEQRSRSIGHRPSLWRRSRNPSGAEMMLGIGGVRLLQQLGIEPCRLSS